MATTGSSFAAIHAGIMPKTIPKNVDIVNPKTIFLLDRTKSKAPIGKKVRKYTNINPIIPPIKHSQTDSNKNWNKINCVFAPSDF